MKKIFNKKNSTKIILQKNLSKKNFVINFFDKNRKDFLPTKIFAKQNFTEIKIVEKKRFANINYCQKYL